MIPSVCVPTTPSVHLDLSLLPVFSFYSIINTETCFTFSIALLTQQAKADLTTIPRT